MRSRFSIFGLVATFLQFLFYIPTPVLSQSSGSCSNITAPLTPEEQTYARAAWATITDNNQPYPQFRSLSTKAAFGWRYLYPDNAYAQKLFDAVKDLRSPDDSGYYAGIYEESKQPNKALTGNTNGLILEILYYKARGNRPLVASGSTSTPIKPPSNHTATPTPITPPDSKPQTPTPAVTSKVEEVAVAPIPPVGNSESSSKLKLTRPLTVVERRYAEAAWRYFQANYHSQSGLINDRSDFKGATLWGLGDYLAALNAARSLCSLADKIFELPDFFVDTLVN